MNRFGTKTRIYTPMPLVSNAAEPERPVRCQSLGAVANLELTIYRRRVTVSLDGLRSGHRDRVELALDRHHRSQVLGDPLLARRPRHERQRHSIRRRR